MQKRIVINTKLIETGDHVESRESIIADYLSAKGWRCYLVDWKDIDEDLRSTIVYDCTNGQFVKGAVNLNEISDMILVRGLGNVKLQFAGIAHYFRTLKEKYTGAVLNDSESMLYGLEKHYLFFLKEKELPIPESIYLDSIVSLDEIKRRSRWKHAIIKPIDGELGIDVFPLDSVTEQQFAVMRNRTKGIILQKKMGGIKNGKRSLFFLGRVFSHSVIKYPHPESFKVNARFNPVYKEYNATKKEIELGKRIVGAWPKRRGYFRFDLVQESGKLFIMEVEAVNPSFYIQHLHDKDAFLERLEKFLLEYQKSSKK